MLVPAALVDLDETDAALGQAAGLEAVGGVGAGLAGVGTVEVEGGLGFLREVHQIGNRGLHPERHFERLDAGGQVSFLTALRLVLLVHLTEQIELRALLRLGHSLSAGQIRDLLALARVERFVNHQIATVTKPLDDISRAEDLQGLAKGLAFQLVENLGVLFRRDVAEDVKSLDQDARAAGEIAQDGWSGRPVLPVSLDASERVTDRKSVV